MDANQKKKNHQRTLEKHKQNDDEDNHNYNEVVEKFSDGDLDSENLFNYDDNSAEGDEDASLDVKNKGKNKGKNESEFDDESDFYGEETFKPAVGQKRGFEYSDESDLQSNQKR